MAAVNNILITGMPGTGKTTLIEAFAKKWDRFRPHGFLTREIRESGQRSGFLLVSLSGHTRILSHITFHSGPKVGRYGVDVGGFEDFLSAIPQKKSGLVIIDEIGKMECLSGEFRRFIIELLDSSCIIVASVARKGTPFIEEIKRRDDVRVLELTRENRDRIARELDAEVSSLLFHRTGSPGS